MPAATRVLRTGVTLALATVLLASCAPASAPAPAAPAVAPAAAPTVAAAPASPAPTPVRAPQPTPTPGGATVRPTPAPVPTVASAATPRRGGDLSLILGADPLTFDGNAEPAYFTFGPSAAVYDTLLNRSMYDLSHRVEPRLATAWEFANGGTVVNLTLRSDVSFSDGTPLTPADVVFTYNRYRDPPKGLVSGYRSDLAPIDKVEAVGANGVRITLSRPVGAILDRLSVVQVYSRKWIEAGNDPSKNMMGTGPFTSTSYLPSLNWKFSANRNFRQKGLPYLDTVTWFILKDQGTRLAALRTGRILVNPSNLSQLTPSERQVLNRERPDLKTFPAPTQFAPWMIINIREKPLSDVRVRRAMNLAIDRQGAIKTAFEGAGDIGFFMQGPGQDWGFSKDELLKTPGFRASKDADRAEAKRLLAEAGYPNGFDTVFQSRTTALFKDTAVYLTDQLSTIGIRAKVEAQDDASLFARGRRGDFSIITLAVSNISRGSFEPSDQLGIYLLPGGPYNWHPYDDKSFQDMFSQLEREIDPQKRTTIARNIQQKLLDDEPGLFIAWSYGYLAVSSRVHDFPEGITNFHRGHFERVWVTQ